MVFQMRILRKHLLLYALIVLLGGNAAKKFDKDVFLQHTDFSQEDVDDDDNVVDYRLPTSVKPISYNIVLMQTSRDNFTFYGQVKIQAEIVNPTDSITLHVGNFQIAISNVSVTGTIENIINDTKYDNVTQKYTFVLSKTLEEEMSVEIFFSYSGILTDNMIGFYKSSYVNKTGEIDWLAATQFQTTHARHAFPCFDEPSFKATFNISLIRLKDYTSLSNMPLKNTENKGDMSVDTYEESIRMSTYMVAFLISKLDSVGENGLKVWARPSAINQTHYALRIGGAALNLLEELFQQKYDLPKMDMVAVPDFAAGAMENWGLVTYRESRMLYDEKESSVVAQQKVASVITHEITHMWFGNLVTPEWWSYLWLSEAFARFYQYFGTAQIEKDWNMEEQFVVEQHQAALKTDSFTSSRPMTREVTTPSQIATAGDSITYAKGASVVRMMDFIFEKDVFQRALQNYLQKNKPKGLSNPDDLWETIQDQIDNNTEPKIKVKAIMDTWTTQAGYPVISVTRENNKLHVTQERFLLRNFFQDETLANVTWHVPLSWTTKSSPDFTDTSVKHWLTTKEHTINNLSEIGDWIILNVQSSGFYRVKYDSYGWWDIFSILDSDKFDEIHVLNRASIMDDLLNLGRAGYENYNTVLNGLTYLKREKNYLPFKAAFNGLSHLNRQFAGRQEHFLFKEFILSLIDGRRKELGYEDREGDDRLTVLLRREINNWACNLGDEECITTYVNKFKKWRANASNPIKPNERSTAYCVAIRNGTSADWEFLWEKYFNSNHADDQMVILSALGCSLNTATLEKYLLHAVSDYKSTRIRRQDSTSVFEAVYNSGPIGAEYILDFVEKHYMDMEKYYGGQNEIAKVLDGASQHFSTLRLVTRFQDFIERHEKRLAPIVKSLKSSLSIARYELKWYMAVSGPIVRYLQKEYESFGKITPRKYFISVAPHLKIGDFTFDGSVEIEADVTEETRQIVLHSAEIKHRTVNVMANKTDVKIIKAEPKQHNFYVIDIAKDLPVGTRLVIKIEYTGHLNASELRGFYKSSYVNEKGETRWLASTHLEPVGARKMFPCFDDPSMKAFFTVQAKVPPGYYSISNTEWRTLEKSDDGSMVYTFYETVRMPTYLVALVVSDFEFKSAGEVNKVNLGVYARPNAINQTEYAAPLMSPLVNFFEDILQQKYQLPKLDMIALPDFPSGAGENLGLMTYRETNMLYDKNQSALASQQRIKNVIAHEISHQWFGNLVGVPWKCLWLKEGFARYFQYHAPARVFNDTTDIQFVVDEVHSALRADSSNSTHALCNDNVSPGEVRSMYSTISYAKGASILRMMEKSYGSAVFYEALRDYLKNGPKDHVASPKDLYDAMEKQVKKTGLKDNVTHTLDVYTMQPGYPVVHVSVKKNAMTLGQERFFLEGGKRDIDPVVWSIPITWASIDNHLDYLNTTPKFWMTTKQQTFNVSLNSLVTLNVQQSGFYRVNYDEQHWSQLTDHLTNGNFSKIHEINRATLIDDLMNLARADYVSYAIVIPATMYLKRENGYLPWRAFYNNLPYLNNRFRGRAIEDLYKVYLRSIISPLYERLGFVDNDNDDHLTKMLRMHTRKWACELDVNNCKLNAEWYFRNKHNYFEEIPPNYRSVSYCTVMRMDMTEWTYNIVWKYYLESNVATDKLVILKSIACSPNKKILEKLLREAITENSSIRFQDSASVFSEVYDASLNGTEAVMSFIGNHYDDMHRYFGGYAKIQSIVSSLASRLSTRDLYKQYQDLLSLLIKKEPAFDKSIASFMTKAEYELDWFERKVPIIFEILDKLFSGNTHRLPDTLYPEYYNVHLIPDIENGTFEGVVQIYMRVKKETTAIVLNTRDIKYKASDIKIQRNYEIGSDNPLAKKIKLQSYTEYAASQQLRIYLTELANTDSLMAEIKFSGTLRDDMKGFYRSSYKDSNGMQHWLATTQFEPTYARTAFPCFDEPAFKSKFIINIKRPNGYHTLSNMPIKETKTEGNYTWDRFHTNDIDMSPYLVAFVVSEFARTANFKDLLANQIPINVWGRPEIAMHGKFAQKTANTLLYILQNFVGIDYQLPKLDLVGVPDFHMGAMENWGLAIFREHALFYDENEISASQKRHIISIIAHEIAHMWFGNLVTCEWWEYIWLNEGFAQYLQWHVPTSIESSYKLMEQFVVYELHPALLKDASSSAHPMTNPVKTPEEINNVFDYVAYGKSASVLRMIFNAFDPTVSKSAIRSYMMEQNKKGTARPEDLWRSFDQHASIEINYKNVSFAEIMDTWTNQAGYPVVNAVLHGYNLTLTQERFLMDEWTVPKEDRHKHDEFYWIPFDIAKSLDPYDIKFETTDWLGPKAVNVYISPANYWYIVNRNQNGFYRVNYDNASWRQLISALNSDRFTSINVMNRAQVIDDLFNLARATYVEYELLMNATKYLKHETQHIPWKAFFNGLSYVYERLEPKPAVQRYLRKYVLDLMSITYDKLNPKTHLARLNKEMFLQWACKLRKAECMKQSKDLFTAWHNDTSKRVPPDARAAVYCTAIRNGNENDWQFLLQQYLQTNFASEKKIIVNALGCSTNETILRSYLRIAVEEYNDVDATFRKQDVAAVFSSVYSASQLGVNVTLDYLINDITEIYDSFGSWDEIVPLFINTASHVSYLEQYNKLNEFVETYVGLNLPKTKLTPAINVARINCMWYDRNAETIHKWLVNQIPVEPETQPNGVAMTEPLHVGLMAVLIIISYLLNYH